MLQKGKLIVIDGSDGSGKTTQTKLLVEKLKENYQVEQIDFPQYNNKSAGLVEEYLGGKYGSAEEVGPKITSIFYAVDRYDASFKIRKWLEDGKIVIANRYVASNMGHQGSKIKDNEERKIFLEWLDQLEYGIFNLPKPSLNIVLHVESHISQKLSIDRAREDWIGKTKDIHEDDLDHLKAAEQTYLFITENYPNFKLIRCTKDNKILPIEQIQNLVWQEIQSIL